MKRSSQYQTLRAIINEVDPIGLVDPNTFQSLDEYEPELDLIFEKQLLQLSIEELGQLIYEVFVNQFSEDLAGDKEKYDTIAKRYITSVKNGC